MTAHDLALRLKSDHPPTLLHVLPEEVFDAARIPGSKNACIYETAFLDKVGELNFDRSAPLVVYGAGAGSQDAAAAAEKFANAGFTAVEAFSGGLAEWKAAGLELEGTGQMPGPPVLDGRYLVDTAESVIRWTGRNLFNHHSGTVRLGGGEIHLRNGKLVTARFAVDMTTIACEDIADSGMNAMLIAHLRTTDFFDVDHHPTAEFSADRMESIEACTEGTPNYRFGGTFTLRGISAPVEFPVVIAGKDDGRHLTGQGVLELDRTLFGSHYGSGRFFHFLGQHIVNDHISLHVKIHSERDNKSD